MRFVTIVCGVVLNLALQAPAHAAAVPSLDRLGDSSRSVRLRTARQFSETAHPDAGRTVDVLVRAALAEQDPRVREFLLQGAYVQGFYLGKPGDGRAEAGKRALSALFATHADAFGALLQSGDLPTVENALRLCHGADQALPVPLVTGALGALQLAHAPVRQLAIEVLALAPRDPAVDEAIGRVARSDPSTNVRAAALMFLAKRGDASPATSALLREALASGDAQMQQGALRALARMGPPAEGAFLDLVLELVAHPPEAWGPAHQSTNSWNACMTAAAMAKVRSGEVVETFVGMLGNDRRAELAIEALGRMGPAAAAAVPALERTAAAEEATPGIQTRVAKALATICAGAAEGTDP